MRILFFGDVVGRDARDTLIAAVPSLRTDYEADVILVNAENAAHGFGVTPQICDDFFKAGVDCLTTGDHAWDKREILPYIDKEPRLLRPLNYPQGTPGQGASVITACSGKKILVVNLLGRTFFIDPVDDPFASIQNLLSQYTLGKNVDAIFVDMHAEATSEKMAMGHFLDGRVSFVVGSHTHVPTADTQILRGGTGYQTDAGMCGNYNSVIGMDTQTAINRFTKKVPRVRFTPVEGDVTLCGVVADLDPTTGLCVSAQSIRIGGHLQPVRPQKKAG